LGKRPRYSEDPERIRPFPVRIPPVDYLEISGNLHYKGMRMIDRKKIPGCPGYCADRQGRIWRKKSGRWVVINPVTHHDGYQYTYVPGMCKQLTQRLVCAAFKGEPTTDLPICLRRAKRQQPRRVRSQRFLKWGTAKGQPRKTQNRLSKEDVLEIRRLWAKGRTQISLA